MLIKTFTADSSAAALKQVRAEMGINAVVLKTRQVAGQGVRGSIEITACLDNPTIEQSTNILSDSQAVLHPTRTRVVAPSRQVRTFTPEVLRGMSGDQRNRLNDSATRSVVAVRTTSASDTEREELRRTMLDSDISLTIIEASLASITKRTAGRPNLASALLDHLTEQLSLSMLPRLSFKDGDRVLFLGAAGSGKTSAMGKLAAHLVFKEKQQTTLTTLDDVKIGACEEMHSYADILGVRAFEYRDTRESFGTKGVAIIDSPSLSTQQAQTQPLLETILAIKPTHRLVVFSALTRSSDISDFAKRIMPFQPTHLVMTMLDLTERWGSVMTAVQETGLPLAFVTNSPAGVGSLNVPDPALFARKILKLGVCHE